MGKRKGDKLVLLVLTVLLVACTDVNADKNVDVGKTETKEVVNVASNVEGVQEEKGEVFGDVLFYLPVEDFSSTNIADIQEEVYNVVGDVQLLDVRLSADSKMVEVVIHAKDYEPLQERKKEELTYLAKSKKETGLFKTFDPSRYLMEYLVVVEDVNKLTDETIKTEYADLIEVGWDFQQILNIVPEDIKVNMVFKDSKGNSKELAVVKYEELQLAKK